MITKWAGPSVYDVWKHQIRPQEYCTTDDSSVPERRSISSCPNTNVNIASYTRQWIFRLGLNVESRTWLLMGFLILLSNGDLSDCKYMIVKLVRDWTLLFRHWIIQSCVSQYRWNCRLVRAVTTLKRTMPNLVLNTRTAFFLIDHGKYNDNGICVIQYLSYGLN